MALPSSAYNLPFRSCSQCLRHPPRIPRYHQRFLNTSSPLRSSAPAAKNPLRSSQSSHAREQEIAQYRRSMLVSAVGIVVCAVGMYGVIKTDVFGASLAKQDSKDKRKDEKTDIGTVRLDGPGSSTSFPGTSVIRIPGQDDALQQVPTGNSSVPFFPTTIRLPRTLASDSPAEELNLKPGEEVPTSSRDEEEYQLLGLGIRTVSFLKIQVYAVGLYVAKSDIPELQKLLVRTAIRPPGQEKTNTDAFIADAATSLVPGERQQLKDLLLDPEQSNEAWNEIFKKSQKKQDEGIRTVLRIVPTRNTDFMHLRDGWVRGITARASAAQKAQNPEFQDESFGTALNDFKTVFGGGLRKSVPKGQPLLLHRNTHGVFDALYEPDPAQPLRWMGRVHDERISRLVWLHYLGGKTVASEAARQSVVEGVMGVVERPVGTV